jgi:hypothetical protein
MKNKVLCEPAAREFSPTGMTEDFRWKRFMAGLGGE